MSLSQSYPDTRQVSDIATLRSTLPLAEGEQILFLSYYSDSPGTIRGPKGGGLFVAVNDANTLIDTGDGEGSFFRVNSSTGWLRIRENPARFDPFEFGARNDLISDDTPYIQYAIRAAGVLSLFEQKDPQGRETARRLGGGIVDLSGAITWRCDSQLKVNTKRFTLECGRSVLDFRRMPGGTIDNHNVAMEFINADGYMLDRIEINNLKLLGPNFPNGGTQTYLDGITLNDKNAYANVPRNSVHFNGLSIEHFHTGLQLGTNAYFVSFDHCQVSNNHIGYAFPDSTNAGEEINFVNSVFSHNDIHISIDAGMNNFRGCSFDYGYDNYIYQTAGVINLTESWLEGKGPQLKEAPSEPEEQQKTYIINIPDNSPARLNMERCQIIFTGANSDATNNFGFLGDKSRVNIDTCYFTRLVSANSPSATVNGWFDGTTPALNLINSQMRVKDISGSYMLRSRIQPQVPNLDNRLDTAQWTSGTEVAYSDEVWLLPPVGGTDTYRVSRYQYGIDAATNRTFSLTRMAGYVSLRVFAAATGSVYQAVIGMIPLKGTGPVCYQTTFDTLAGSGNGSTTFKIIWVKANTYGPTNAKEPDIVRQLEGSHFTFTFNGNPSTLKTVVTPINMPTVESPPPAWDRAPHWATHAILVCDVSALSRSTELRLKDVYLRQI
ncbi:hypothetical protein [Serratia entomophila]|uniref:hypothetical protein n=1 Tax=Serratia entomophila TaxID=42906 RepID=UPI002178088E|nr:hypothetical protein [Serratia entomophila]CAI1628668.1 Uncharacterised protein [Serratia entomophila]